MSEPSLPPVPFAVGMASSNGSRPFAALSFDDGAAVSLHSVLGLAAELGLAPAGETLFDLLGDWDRSLDMLAVLVQALAYDDRARGYRGRFVPQELLEPELLLAETRQVFRVDADGALCLPVTVQAPANASLTLDERGRAAIPRFALAAVIGRTPPVGAGSPSAAVVAGWSLAVELVRDGCAGLAAHGAAASLALGPVMVPTAFAGELEGVAYRFAAMGSTIAEGNLGVLAAIARRAVATLSSDVRLLPGDVVIVSDPEARPAPAAGTIDILEASASGFGQIKISLR